MWPFLAVLAASLLFTTTGTSQALADVDASALAVGAARMVVGGGALGLLALAAAPSSPVPTSSPVVPTTSPTPGGSAVGRKMPAALWLALGALGALGYQLFFFAGTRANGVAIGTVVTLGVAAVLAGLLETAWQRMRPSGQWMAATAVALVGVVLVSGVVGGADAVLHPAGLAASAGAGASYAVYTVAGKGLIQLGWGSTRAMGAMFGLAAVASVPLLLWAGAGWLLTWRGAALTAWLGLVTMTVAYVLFGWGLARLNSSTVVTLSLVEPMGATLLGLLVLHEQLTPLAAAGMGVIVAGLLLLAIPHRARQAHSVVELTS